MSGADETNAASNRRDGPWEMLNRLLVLFPDADQEFGQGLFELVANDELPTPFDELLFHEEHLPGVMENMHGGISVR